MMRGALGFGRVKLSKLLEVLEVRVSNGAWHSLQSTAAVPATPSSARALHASCTPSWHCFQFRLPAYGQMYAFCSKPEACQHNWSSLGCAHNSIPQVTHSTASSECARCLLPTYARVGWALGQASVASVSSIHGGSQYAKTTPLGAIRNSSSLGAPVGTNRSGILTVRSGHSLWGSHCSLQWKRSIHASSLQADSVLRKRRTKMKRHKWKKRQRLLRRKSKVSQGAKK